MKPSLSRRCVAEFVGTAFLVATVIGSGVMAERLSNGNVALALLANTIATGAVLVALIFAFGGVSAHFNPVVSVMDAFEGGLPWGDVTYYLVSQVAGGLLGAILAHLMFGLSVVSLSRHIRSGPAQVFSEFMATFGLMTVIWDVPGLDPVPFRSLSEHTSQRHTGLQHLHRLRIPLLRLREVSATPSQVSGR